MIKKNKKKLKKKKIKKSLKQKNKKTAVKSKSKSKSKKKSLKKVSKTKISPKKLKVDFKIDQYIVYPNHGVGKITDIEKRSIAGIKLDLYVIEFKQDRMLLRVPISKSETLKLRKVVSSSKMKQAISILKEKARSKNTMWSRRAQEYDEKINSGKPVMVAEVIRDLHRKENQAEQSHSERQLYEQALDRLGREMAVVFSINDKAAIEKIEKALAKKN